MGRPPVEYIRSASSLCSSRINGCSSSQTVTCTVLSRFGPVTNGITWERVSSRSRIRLNSVRIVRRTVLVLGIALASGAVVMTLCYVGDTLQAGQPLYACHPNQIKSGRYNVDIPTTNIETCGIAPVAWWVKAAGVSAFIVGGTETVLMLRRKRGPTKRAKRTRTPALVP